MSFAASQLRLDWASHQVEVLTAGLAIVTVPLSGGSASCWTRFVENVQRLSASAVHGPAWLQLVGAHYEPWREQMLEIGVDGNRLSGVRLESNLRAAVADANAWAAPDVWRRFDPEPPLTAVIPAAFVQHH